MSETQTQIELELIVVGHSLWGNKYLWLPLYIPVCGAHDRPWQMSGQYAKTVNFKSSWLDIITYFAKMVRHKQLIGIICCPAVILSSVYDNHVVQFCMHECFRSIYKHFCHWEHVWAYLHLSMKPLYCEHHFSHSVFLLLNTASSWFLWHNLAHFGIPYLCPLNPKTFRREHHSLTIKNLQLILVTNSSIGDIYVTCTLIMCISNLIAYLLQNGSEQCVELQYSFTKLLK